MTKVRKFQEGNQVEENVETKDESLDEASVSTPKDNITDSVTDDWFTGRLSGQLSGNYADLRNKYGDTEFTLKSKEEYKENEDLMNSLKSEYGSDADKKFDEFYEQIEKDYNDYTSQNYSLLATSEIMALKGTGGYFGDLQEREFSYDQEDVRQTASGSINMFGDMTQQRWDSRKTMVDPGLIKNYKGELQEIDWDKEDEEGNNYGFEDNEEGKKFIGAVYNPDTLNPYYRGERYMQAVYEDEYDKYAGHEVVSGWELRYGWDDPALNSSVGRTIAAIPKAASNFVANFMESFAKIGLSASTIFEADDASRYFQDMAMTWKGAQWSKSREAQENPFSSGEGLSSFISDIAIQLLAARGIGIAASGVATGLQAAVKTGSITQKALYTKRGFDIAARTKATANTAKYASRIGLTMTATKDFYDSSIEAGFTAKEAAWLQFASLGAMWWANSKFDKWVTEPIEAVRVNRELTNLVTKDLPYVVKALKESGEEVTPNVAKRVYQGLKHKLAKLAEKASAVKGIPGAGLSEAGEEVAEFLSEETIKHLANVYSNIMQSEKIGNPGTETQGHFKDMTDDGYWPQFWAELGVSAAGGFIGGAGAKIFMSNNMRSDTERKALVDVILAGEGDKYLAEIDNLYNKGALGNSKLSIIPTDSGDGTYKPMSTFGSSEAALSHNDANRELLQQEYNYVKSVVDSLGGPAAYKALVKKYPDLETNLQNISVGKDISNLTGRYISLLKDNPDLEGEMIPALPENSTQEDIDKFIVSHTEKSGLQPEVVEEIARIKRDIQDIQSGKAAEKYYLQSSLTGSKFDPKVEGFNPAFNKYGDNLFFNMLSASSNTALELEGVRKDAEIVLKSNEEAVNGLKADLSNIDEVTKNFPTDRDNYLTVKGKEKLADLREKYKPSKSDLNSIKKSLNKDLSAKYENLNESNLVKTLVAQHPELENKIKEFVSTYYNEKLKAQLDSLESFDDIDAFDIEEVSEKLFDILNNYSASEYGTTATLLKGNIIDALSSTDNVKNLANIVAQDLAQDSKNYNDFFNKTSFSNALSNSQEASETFNGLTENYFKLVDLTDRAGSMKTEIDNSSKPTDIISILNREFSGNKDNIEDGVDLLDRVNGLIQQAESQQVGDKPEQTTFNNVTETEEVLEMLNIRMAQIDQLYRLADGLAEFRKRRSDIQNNKQGEKSSVDLLESAIKDSEKYGISELFNNVFFNPTLYRELLNKKEKGTLTEQETEELQDIENTLQAVSKLYMSGFDEEGNIIESGVFFQAKEKLESLLDIAKKNQSGEGLEDLHRNSLNKNLNKELDIISALIEEGNLDERNELAADFKTYTFGVDRGKDDEESLVEKFGQVYNMKRLLFGLDPDEKSNLLDSYFKLFKKYGDTSDFLSAINMLHFNQEEFYKKYKTVLKDNKLGGIPSSDQEEVAISVAAHMNGKVDEVYRSYTGDENSDLHYTIFVSGVQGSGKSSFVVGVGAKIAQDIQKEQYKSSEKTKILLASNSKQQLDVLKTTAKKFKLDTEPVGGNDGVQLEELLSMLEKNEELDNISTIIYDEATFIEYSFMNKPDNTPYPDKSVLAKIMQNIDEINKTRNIEKQPLLKLVLMGDEDQNGFINKETGVEDNVGTAKSRFYTPTKLVDSFRTNITLLTNAIEKIKKRKGGKLNNINTQWGYIASDMEETVQLRGGVKFEKSEDDVFNDTALAKEIEERIAISRVKDETFTVGIITDSAIPAESEIAKLQKKYPDNFPQFTHEAVQGQEFDYVLAKLTADDIGKYASAKQTKGEKLAAKKLSTTIGRAKYFAAVVNDTGRYFTSEKTDSDILISQQIDEKLADQVREIKINMIPGEGVALTEVTDVVKDEDDIKDDAVKNDDSNTEPEMEGEDVEVSKEEDVEDVVDLSKETKEEFEGAAFVSGSVTADETITVEEFDNIIKEEQQEKEIAKESIKANTDIDTKDISQLQQELEVLHEQFEEGEDVVEDIKNKNRQLALLTGKDPELSADVSLAIKEALDATMGVTVDEKGKRDLDRESKEVQMAFEDELGLLAGYTHIRKGNIEGIDNDISILSEIYGKENIASKDQYKSLQLEAINLKKKSRRNSGNFSYKLVGYPYTASNGQEYTGVIVTAQDNDTNKHVIVGYLPVLDIKNNNSVGKNLIEKIDDKRRSSAEGIVEYNIKDINNVIGFVSNGALKRGDNKTDKITVKEFFETKAKDLSNGLFLNSRIMISTDKNSPHRGDAFLFYSYNDLNNLSSSNLNDIITNGRPAWKKDDKPHKGFKNGLGVIRLDAKPAKVSELYTMMTSVVEDKNISYLEKIVNSRKNEERMVKALLELRAIITDPEFQILNEDIEPSERITNLLAKSLEDGTSQFEGDQILKVVSDMMLAKEKYPARFEIFKNALLEMTSKKSLGKYVHDGNGFGVKQNQQGEFYPIISDKTNPITYLPGDNIGEEGQNMKDNFRFNLRRFFSAVEIQTDFARKSKTIDTANVEYKDIFSLFDAFLLHSKNFEKGLYIRPNIVKDGEDNKQFASAKYIKDLDTKYLINVTDIQSPIVYFQADALSEEIDADYSITEVEPEVSDTEKRLQQERLSQLEKSTEELLKEMDNSSDADSAWITVTEKREELLAEYSEDELAEFDSLTESLYDEILERNNTNTSNSNELENNLDNQVNELLNNKSQIEREKEEVRRNYTKGESNLSDDEWAYVRTPSFMKWSGDWLNNPDKVSILLDENGEPKKLYHYSVDSRLGEEEGDIPYVDSMEKALSLHTQSLSDLGIKQEDIPDYITNSSKLNEVFIKSNKKFIQSNNKDVKEALSKTIEPEFEDGDYNKLIQIANNQVKQGKSGVQASDMTDPNNVQLVSNYPNLFEEIIKAIDAEQKTISTFNKEKILAGKESLIDIYDPSYTVNNVTGKLNIKWEQGEPLSVNNITNFTFGHPYVDRLMNLDKNFSREDDIDGEVDTFVTQEEDGNIYIIKDQDSQVSVLPKENDIRENIPTEEDQADVKAFKQEAEELVGRFKQMRNFMFDTDELNIFRQETLDLIEGNAAKLVNIINPKLVAQIESITKNMELLLNETILDRFSSKEALRVEITKNMESSINTQDIPVLGMNISDDLEENSLTTLLIKYHLNNKPENIKRVISRKFLKDAEENPLDIVANLLSTPEITSEQFAEKGNTFRKMFEEGLISSEQLIEAVEIMKNRMGKIKEYEDFFTALYSEEGVTEEYANRVLDSDFKTLVQDSLDGNLSEEGQKIINSTWGEVENLLSSDKPLINNLAEIDSQSLKVKNVISKAEVQFNAYSSFILDETIKAEQLKRFNEMIGALNNKLNSDIETIGSIIENIPNPVEVTEDNLTPAQFFNSELTITLDAKALEVVNKLTEDSKFKKLWISHLNSELGNEQMSQQQELFDKILDLTVNDFATEELIIDYMTNKMQDLKCRK